MKVKAVGLSALVVLGCSGHPTGFGDVDGGDNGDAGNCNGFSCGGLDGGFGGDGAAMGCSPNPANYDIPGNNCDDDGDGVVDNPPGMCDSGLAPTGSAANMAAALGLCTGTKPAVADATHWGVVSATYTKGYNTTAAPGAAAQHGIMTKFGNTITPRQGSSFGVLSSGYAADYDQCDTPMGPFKGGCPMDPSDNGSAAPPGYPKPVGSCTPATDVHDASALILKIKVPANANGLSFDFDFFSGEWPEWVCTTFNDSFVAWLQSSAFTGKGGDLNVSYDTNGNPINVNNAFFQACSPANAIVGCMGNTSTDKCMLGNGELQGTGFYDPGSDCGQSDSGGGSTSWLTTKAPVAPGETITLQLIIWDTGDQAYDSTVLLDDWQWQPGQTSVSTNPVN
jgi:hypothetical protein